MGVIAQQFKWLEDKPGMTVKEIASYEKIKHGTMKNWFSEEQYDVARVRARVELYRKSGGTGRRKMYLYRDGERYPIEEIQKREPHMSKSYIQYRYRMCDEGDWDAIFAPHKKSVPAKDTKEIWREECAGLGPRRSPESIKPPTDYERRLWTGDAY